MTIESTNTTGGLDAFVAQHRDTLLLLARFAMGYIFIESAFGHMDFARFAATYKNFFLPEPLGVPAAVLGMLVELLGGIALVVGYRVRETSVLLILFLIVTICIGHRFWELEGAARRMQVIQIKKNVAIIGGFLTLLISGGGRYSFSARAAR